MLSLSLEICSETNGYRNDWKSDISFYINRREIASWLSPGDMGGKCGNLNPLWWPRINTQYGFLKTVSVTDDGCLLDGERINSEFNLQNIGLDEGNCMAFTVANKAGCRHKGGFNIFGKNFGNYPQDIELEVIYE